MDNTKNSPVFILGAPRSGTTLLRLMLNAHSRIGIPEEIHFFRSTMFGNQIDKWSEEIFLTEANLSEMKSMLSFMAHDTGMSYLAEVGSCAASGSFLLRDLYEEITCRFLGTEGKTRWGEKTPENILYSDILQNMFPTAKFILMKRDPRAVIVSMNKVFFYPSDTATNLLNYMHYNDNGYKRVETCIPPENRFEITYEELVANPRPAMQKICSFIEEDFEYGMLDFYRNAGAFMSSSASSTYNVNARGPVTSSSTNSWRNQLSESDLFLISSVLRLDEYEGSLSVNEKDDILLKFRERQIEWINARRMHDCSRDFQIRNPGQSINSNRPLKELMP